MAAAPSPLPDAGFDVLLADGSAAHVRPICAADRDGVRAFYGRLSAESLRLRFFSPRPPPYDAEIEHLVGLRGPDDLVLVVERGAALLAMAQYDRSPGSDSAEVAFVVDDSCHGLGLGTLLLEHLAATARLHGIKRFEAVTLAENRPMQRVFRDAGFARTSSWDGTEVHVVLDIAPTPPAMAAMDERDRSATVRSMGRLLQPRSVAVVGASRTPGTIGHELVVNLVRGEFQGPVFPVNPGAPSVASLPCWPSVDDIPGPVDLALVAVPAPTVPDVVAACGRHGVGGLIIISAGFAELDGGGAEAERHIAHLAHVNGMRLIGPNCFGVVNTDAAVMLNATFAADTPLPGRVGFASQSGGLGIAILAEARHRGLGLSTFVSMGNKADVSGNDLLTWWEQDDATDVILLYLESFGNPRKFSRIARRVGRTKPIVAVKGGRSRAGSRAAASHTAALASSDEAVDALFRQTGVVRVDTIEELFDVGDVLAHQPIPTGARVVIVTNAGGPGVLAADACAARRLEVPELSDALRCALLELAPNASVGNPVDLIASANAETFGRALDLLLASGEVDGLVVIFTPPVGTSPTEVADAVVGSADRASRAGRALPVIAAFTGAPEAVRHLRAATPPVPCFAYPETAVRALGYAVDYGVWRARPVADVPTLSSVDPNEARHRVGSRPPGSWITGAVAVDVLADYGIPAARTIEVSDGPAAVDAALALGFPVALKACGPVHKAEVGGVRLGLATPDGVRDAFAEMHDALGTAMTGSIVQSMVEGGVETIVGFVSDREFGPQVLFGLGGTAVEILGDHTSRLAPLSVADATEMVMGLRATPLLTGFRGSAPVDTAALVNVLLRVGRLAEDLPEIVEADLNPVIVSPAGATVVDVRLRLGSDEEPVDTGSARHLR